MPSTYPDDLVRALITPKARLARLPASMWGRHLEYSCGPAQGSLGLSPTKAPSVEPAYQ